MTTRQFSDISTYAEKMLLHENALVKIRDDMPLDRAALIGCGVTTGVGAVLNTAKIEPGSTVAVFGCGRRRTLAIQGARIAGAAMIIAVDTFETSSRRPSGRRDPHRRRLVARSGRGHPGRLPTAESTTRSRRSASRKPPSSASTRSRPAAPRPLSG